MFCYMEVKHHHNCLLCNTQRTCFVFDNEFSLLFSICRDCYDQFVLSLPAFTVEQEICSFCEMPAMVKKVEGFDDAMFFSDLFICEDCSKKIISSIEQHD